MRRVIFYLSILLAINIPSLYYGWYMRWDEFDTVQHFLGGFLIAMLMYHYLKDHLREGSSLKNMLIIVGATIFIGVVWEFSEYIANQTLIEPMYRYFGIRGYFMGDLNDTMVDLLMDISGGILYSLLYVLGRKKN